jgi:antagonist of KipI
MTIRVKRPGMLTTVQDLGRYGYAHLGISPAGAADSIALRIANRLAGNDENAPTLEMTLLGATLEFDEPCVVALTGSDCDCKIGNVEIAMCEALEVNAGDVLSCGPVRSGARAYLAVRGGFDVPDVLGSASTNLNGAFGGLEGRALKKGDVLRVRRSSASTRANAHAKLRLGAAELAERLYPESALRITRGAQADWFEADASAKLCGSRYQVTEDSNRSGLRLKGEALAPRESEQFVTEGVSLGAVQVPPDGLPIILFVDQQTTGGYLKIANVIAADLHRVGQLRPRHEVRFEEVTIPEAVRLLREQEKWLERSFAPSRKRR